MEKKLKFFYSDKLPYLESRYSKHSLDCYKEHTHDTLSIGAVENGSTKFSIQEREYTLYPKELAVINPHTIHACNPYKEDARDYHMIYLDTTWCQELQNSIFNTNNEFLPLKQELVQDRHLFKELCNINHTLFKKSYLLEIESRLIEWLNIIFIRYCGAIEKPQKLTSVKLEKIARYLQDSYEENISLEELSSLFHMNTYTLLRNFKKQYDLTPHTFQINYRIQKAKEFLKQDISLSEVALSSGFFDQSHFQKHFKQRVAVTPKEYRVNFIQ